MLYQITINNTVALYIRLIVIFVNSDVWKGKIKVQINVFK